MRHQLRCARCRGFVRAGRDCARCALPALRPLWLVLPSVYQHYARLGQAREEMERDAD
jgi:hypothetical protein